jgi:AcrR family transcriptional regulator
MEESFDCPWPSVVPGLFRSHRRHERRDAAEHRQRILEVARRLFAEQGVEAVSMHQIAKAAGIGQGTLYRRYAHKGALCIDLLQESHERFVEEITSLLAATTTSPALERLDGVLEHMVAFLEEQGALLSPIAVANARYWLCGESGSSQHAPMNDWLREVLAGLLAEAVERGELVSLDIPYVADAILTTLNPMFYRYQRQERGFSAERILQGLRRIYIDGVRAPESHLISVPQIFNQIPPSLDETQLSQHSVGKGNLVDQDADQEA